MEDLVERKCCFCSYKYYHEKNISYISLCPRCHKDGYFESHYTKNGIKPCSIYLGAENIGKMTSDIKPFIGQLKLTDLNGIVLQEFFNEKYKSGRLDHKGGLSEKTVLNIRQMLHAALRKALENGFIPASYVEHVRLQKVSIPDIKLSSVMDLKKGFQLRIRRNTMSTMLI